MDAPRTPGLTTARSVRLVLSCVALWLACAVSLASPATHLVMDGTGRKVAVPAHPQRIICLAPSVADDAFAVGAGAQVVAVSAYTHYPAEAAQKLSIGQPGSPSLEQILALHPDLVLATEGLNHQETVQVLQQHGIAVFVVHPVGLAGVYTSIAQVGEALGRQSESSILLASLHSRERALRAAGASRPTLKIFLPVWYDPVITIGKGAYLTELLSIVGLQSVTSDIAQEWPHVALEAILARDPDRLILVRGGGIDPAQLAGRPGWSALRALHTGKILYVDERIELPSPVCFDALEALARELTGAA